MTFELPASLWADRVALVGDFNNWDDRSLPFRQERDGCWRARILLPGGRKYYFCYVIDDQWCGDFAVPCVEGVIPIECKGPRYGCVLETAPLPENNDAGERTFLKGGV